MEDVFNKSYLTPEYKQLAADLYSNMIQPIESDFFKNTLPKVSETLATRGIQFGGLGSKYFSDLLDSLGQTKYNMAGNIATSIGQSALEKAYLSNEANLQREFQKNTQGTQNAFNAGESALDRSLQKEIKGLDLASSENILNKQQSFQQSESALDRALNSSQFNAQQAQQAQQFLQSLGLDTEKLKVQQSESALDRALNSSQFNAQQAQQAQQFLQSLGLDTEKLKVQQSESALDRALSSSQFNAQQAQQAQQFLQSLELDTEKLKSMERQAGLDRDATKSNQQYAALLPLLQSGQITSSMFNQITGQNLQAKTQSQLDLESGALASGFVDPATGTLDMQGYLNYLKLLPEKEAKQQILMALLSSNKNADQNTVDSLYKLVTNEGTVQISTENRLDSLLKRKGLIK